MVALSNLGGSPQNTEGRDIFGSGVTLSIFRSRTFKVPEGVTKLRVSVFGAGGGSDFPSNTDNTTSGEQTLLGEFHPDL